MGPTRGRLEESKRPLSARVRDARKGDGGGTHRLVVQLTHEYALRPESVSGYIGAGAGRSWSGTAHPCAPDGPSETARGRMSRPNVSAGHCEMRDSQPYAHPRFSCLNGVHSMDDGQA